MLVAPPPEATKEKVLDELEELPGTVNPMEKEPPRPTKAVSAEPGLMVTCTVLPPGRLVDPLTCTFPPPGPRDAGEALSMVIQVAAATLIVTEFDSIRPDQPP